MFLRLIAVLCLGWGLSSSAQAVPRDIQLVSATWELTQQSKTTSAKDLDREGLYTEALRQVDQMARARGYPTWFSSKNEIVAEATRKTVDRSLKIDDLVSDQTRIATADIFSTTLAILSGEIPSAAMAEAVGSPLNTSKSSTKKLPIAESLQVTGGGDLRIDVEASVLTVDKGGVGDSNGVVDPGEMAKIKLAFRNRSDRRLMSTSVYVSSTSDCVWTPHEPSEEFELSELNPREADSRHSFIFYVSNECTQSTAQIRLKALDSNAFSSTPILFTLSFPIRGVASSRLSAVKLDGDDPGFSEPTSTDVLQADSRFELSTGLSFSGLLEGSLLQTLSVPSPLTGTHSPGAVILTHSGGESRAGAWDESRAGAWDDVDITVPSARALQTGLGPWAKDWNWQQASDARLMVSVDSQVLVPHPPVSGREPAYHPAYAVRHYIELRVPWTVPEKEPLACRLGASARVQGLSVNAKGRVTSLPSDSKVLLVFSTGEKLPLSLSSSGSFSKRVYLDAFPTDSNGEPTSVTETLYVVVQGANGEVLCKDQRDITFTPIPKRTTPATTTARHIPDEPSPPQKVNPLVPTGIALLATGVITVGVAEETGPTASGVVLASAGAVMLFYGLSHPLSTQGWSLAPTPGGARLQSTWRF